MTILYFIIALGVLVSIHEFGHFIVAKLQGIGVEKFSIGFGPKLVGFRRGETEYVISGLPLGGFVKLHGEDPAEADQNDPKSFATRPLWDRLRVVLAGPGMNLLLALVLLPLVFMIGRMEPAFLQERPVVMGVRHGSPAEQAGLQKGDEIVAIGDHAYATWKDLLDDVILRGGERVTLKFQRAGQPVSRDLVIEGADSAHRSESGVGTLGVEPQFFVGNEAVVDEVMGGSPAEQAGLKVDDRILAINNTPVEGWTEMTELVNQKGGKGLDLFVERAGTKIHSTITPRHDEASGRWLLGIKKDFEKHGPMMVERRYPFIQAVMEGTKENLKLAKMTYGVLGRLVSGRLSYKTLGGPIRIAQASAVAARAGLSHFLYFLAFLSLQLGLLNLLPIPVLDGGHVLFYSIEGVIRRPLSMRVRGIMENVGFVVLLSLMVLITCNDVDSVWGLHSLFEKIRGLF